MARYACESLITIRTMMDGKFSWGVGSVNLRVCSDGIELFPRINTNDAQLREYTYDLWNTRGIAVSCMKYVVFVESVMQVKWPRSSMVHCISTVEAHTFLHLFFPRPGSLHTPDLEANCLFVINWAYAHDWQDNRPAINSSHN